LSRTKSTIPLAGILVYARLLLKRLGRNGDAEADSDDTRKHLETIAAESARCGEIVKGLLHFSRQTSPHMKPNDLNAIIKESVRLVHHKIRIKRRRGDNQMRARSQTDRLRRTTD
jgi:two-component system NtrC family sensor kinase